VKSTISLAAAGLALVLGASGWITATDDAQARVRVRVPARNTQAFYVSRLKMCDTHLKGLYRNLGNDVFVHARGFCISDVEPEAWEPNYWRHYSYSYGYYGYGRRHRWDRW
jgi:hypothetical protein